MKNSILFGNGLNYLSDDQISWNDLLNKIKGTNQFDSISLPNTMIYEKIMLHKHFNPNESIRNTESNLKNEIADILKKQKTNQFYDKLLNLKFDNYLTTNYDFALNDSFKTKSKNNWIKNNSTEGIYSIRRNTSFFDSKNNEHCKIWNIHGEVSNPKSIMLGLDHYCGSIGKIDGYLKGNYEYQVENKKHQTIPIKEKINTNEFDNVSWVELFFITNLHIIGFGLDYSEIDLWWIINKRARLKKEVSIQNKIKFYVSPLEKLLKPQRDYGKYIQEKNKRELLKSFDVEIIEVPIDVSLFDKKYKVQYQDIIDRIKASR
jgi:hypothetical protein